MKFVKLTLMGCVLAGSVATYAWTAPSKDQIVPSEAKSAAEVISHLQKNGTSNIRSVEFDKNQWNVKTQHGQKETHYQVDAKSGHVTMTKEEPRHETAPPKNVLGILEVINVVKRQGLNGIRNVEYDDNLWKVEVFQDGKVTRLSLDPVAGEILWRDTKACNVNGTNNGIKNGTNNGTKNGIKNGTNNGTKNGIKNGTKNNGMNYNGINKNGTNKNGTDKSSPKSYLPW